MPREYDVEAVRNGGTYEDVSIDLLREIPLPPKGDRTRWFGVQHGELLDTLREAIGNAGLSYDKDTWTLSGKAERLFGYINVSLSKEQFEWTKKELNLPDELEYENFAFSEIDLRMGLRHSNDSTIALYLMVIPTVRAFGNGITVTGGNISLCRKHTQAIGETEDGLIEAIRSGVKTFLLKAAHLQQEIKILRSIPLTDRSAHHIMIVAASKKVVPWSSLGKVKKLWAEMNGASAWDLYMCFTRVGAAYNIAREMSIVSQSRKLILDICNEAEDVIEAEGMIDPDNVAEDIPEEDTEQEEPPVQRVPPVNIPKPAPVVVTKTWDTVDIL